MPLPRKPTPRWVEIVILVTTALLYQLVRIQKFFLSLTYAAIALLQSKLANL